MRKLAVLFAVASFTGALALAGGASAQTIDKAGNCHAKDGKLAKMEVCKPLAKVGPCKDAKTGKFIACAAVAKGPCKDPKTGQFISCAKATPAKATPATPAIPAKPAVATMSKATPAKPAVPATPPKRK